MVFRYHAARIVKMIFEFFFLTVPHHSMGYKIMQLQVWFKTHELFNIGDYKLITKELGILDKVIRYLLNKHVVYEPALYAKLVL